MLKSLIAGIAIIATLTGGGLYNLNPFGGEKINTTRWEGSTDITMLEQVRKDLATAKEDRATKLEVKILSTGGPVITSLEIARLVRKASNEGLTVEITAEGVCASGCTFVLASGTPGHRFITKNALYTVHPIQRGGFGGSVCVDRKGQHDEDYDPDAKPSTNEAVNDKKAEEKPKRPTEQDKVINALYDAMVNNYVEYSGQDQETIEYWMTCGRSQVGLVELAVKLKLADAVRG